MIFTCFPCNYNSILNILNNSLSPATHQPFTDTYTHTHTHTHTLTRFLSLSHTGVQPERLVDAFNVKHCALSLVGEPIMYPRINEMLHALHDRKISTFLVTNAQVSEDNIKVFGLLNTLTRTHYYRSRHPCRFSFCSLSISLPLSHSLSPSLSLSLRLPHSLSLTLSSPSRSEI